MGRQPTFLSLFSGCGGMDAGFIDAGFNCLQAFDINKSAVEIHNLNLGNSAVVADLRTIETAQLLARGTPDVVIAGSPCQGFSTVGRRELHDPRNSLLLQAGKIAIELDPKVFVAENVAGALSGEHRIYWSELEKMLENAGYRTETMRFNASDLGLAQNRSRIMLFAWKSALDLRFPKLKSINTTLKKALQDVDKTIDHTPALLIAGSKDFLIANHISQGQKLSNVRGGPSAIHTWDIPEVFGVTTEKERLVLNTTMVLRRRDRKRSFGDADPISIDSITCEIGSCAKSTVYRLIEKKYLKNIDDCVDLVNTFNGLYKRLKWDAAALTVDTKFGEPRFFLHPTENRGFTMREAARIQGFPDNFKFSEKNKRKFLNDRKCSSAAHGKSCSTWCEIFVRMMVAVQIIKI